jgi:acetoin utilization deacetylase AcuC-like enzyme
VRTVASDDHRSHHSVELDRGRLVPSWDHPERADRIRQAVAAADLGPIVEPESLDRDLLGRVHDPDYVAFLEGAWERWERSAYDAPAAMGIAWPGRRLGRQRPDDLLGQLGYYSFAADCSIVAGTWKAAATSAAVAQTAARIVADGDPASFALCRPPGHHAMSDQFGGYCYLNNAAVAAQLLADHGADRVGVLDLDHHHGNGTQDIFFARSDVAFCSLHADPRHRFPWFLGHADERGAGAGDGYSRNLPLPAGTGVSAWMDALEHGLSWLGSIGIDALVVSLGVDTFVDDPISDFALTTADYPLIGRRLAVTGLPTVFVMEGGYATDSLGPNVVGVLEAFLEGD